MNFPMYEVEKCRVLIRKKIKIKEEMRLLQTGLGRLDLKKVGSCVKLRGRHF